MDWILEHFKIVALIALAVGSFVKSRLEAQAKANQQPAEPDLEDAFAPDEDYRVPPPQVMPSVPPPLSIAAAVASNETAKALKHQLDLAAHLRQIRETKATTTGGAAATRARVAAKGVAKPFPQGPASLRGRLRDHREVRRAVVMREILDPPLGLR